MTYWLLHAIFSFFFVPATKRRGILFAICLWQRRGAARYSFCYDTENRVLSKVLGHNSVIGRLQQALILELKKNLTVHTIEIDSRSKTNPTVAYQSPCHAIDLLVKFSKSISRINGNLLRRNHRRDIEEHKRARLAYGGLKIRSNCKELLHDTLHTEIVRYRTYDVRT